MMESKWIAGWLDHVTRFDMLSLIGLHGQCSLMLLDIIGSTASSLVGQKLWSLVSASCLVGEIVVGKQRI